MCPLWGYLKQCCRSKVKSSDDLNSRMTLAVIICFTCLFVCYCCCFLRDFYVKVDTVILRNGMNKVFSIL